MSTHPVRACSLCQSARFAASPSQGRVSAARGVSPSSSPRLQSPARAESVLGTAAAPARKGALPPPQPIRVPPCQGGSHHDEHIPSQGMLPVPVGPFRGLAFSGACVSRSGRQP
eukprot:2309888-Rhodomonas_salina.2